MKTEEENYDINRLKYLVFSVGSVCLCYVFKPGN
jgi:hypothetical protein